MAAFLGRGVARQQWWSADRSGRARDRSGAAFGGRAPIRLPIFDASETLEVKSSLVLPKAPPEFFSELRALTLEQLERGQRSLLEQ